MSGCEQITWLKKMATLFSFVLCVLSLFQLTVGNGCQSTNDPCKAKCGGKTVDLSHMLKYPWEHVVIIINCYL